MMAPSATNPDQFASPTRDETLLSSFQPKIYHLSPSLNLGKSPTTQTQRIASPSITSRDDAYPSDSSDALKLFNQSSLRHEDRKGSHLTAISDLTYEFAGNEEWDTGPKQKQKFSEGDETDHIATIINIKMQLAQAQAKNDHLTMLLRQCMTEKIELECKMRAQLRSSGRTATVKRSAYNHHHSFHAPPSYEQPTHAPPSYQPANNVQRVHHPTVHVHSTHEPIVWHEETLSTNGGPNKVGYVNKLVTQKYRDGLVKVVKHK